MTKWKKTINLLAKKGVVSSKRAGLTIEVGNLQEVIIELRKKTLPVLAIINKESSQ